MSYLAAIPTALVGAPPNLPEGVAWPEISYQVHDLGERDDVSFYGASLAKILGLAGRADGAEPTIAGLNAIYQENGKWYAWRETDGGGSRRCCTTREEAEQEFGPMVAQTAGFWMEKVKWQLQGDLADPPSYRRFEKPRPVIRCGGTHYVIGHEPSDSELRSNRQYGGLGFGGHQMAFRMFATGERVQTRNCWYQGRIPAEFRDLLPDNAESVESDETIAQRERAAAWREEQDAQRQERVWRDDALRAWRGPAEELTAHEVLVAWEAADRVESQRRSEESAARQQVEKWRAEAYRAWRGTWVDLIGYEQEWWQAEQDYRDEMWADYYGSVL